MVNLESITVDTDNSALIVVDLQKDFCASEQGCAYFERQLIENRDGLTPIQKMIDNYLMPFIDKARKSNLHIVYIQSIYKEGQFQDMPKLCLEGTRGWELYKVNPDSQGQREIVIHKDAHNPFNNGNGLENFLNENNINTLLISGVTTDNCVSATTYVSLGRGYRPIVLADCVATAGYKIVTAHKQKLAEFAAHPDIGLVNSADVHFKA